MLFLKETIDQLAIENSVRWYGPQWRREDSHVFRMIFDFEIEGHWKKGMIRRTWKKLVEEESMKVGFRREDGLRRSKLSVGVNMIAAGFR